MRPSRFQTQRGGLSYDANRCVCVCVCVLNSLTAKASLELDLEIQELTLLRGKSPASCCAVASKSTERVYYTCSIY